MKENHKSRLAQEIRIYLAWIFPFISICLVIADLIYALSYGTSGSETNKELAMEGFNSFAFCLLLLLSVLLNIDGFYVSLKQRSRWQGKVGVALNLVPILLILWLCFYEFLLEATLHFH